MHALKFLETEIHNLLTRVFGNEHDTRDAVKGEISSLVENITPMILAEAKSLTAVAAEAPVA